MNEDSAYQNGCNAALIAYDIVLKEKDTTLAIKFFLNQRWRPISLTMNLIHSLEPI